MEMEIINTIYQRYISIALNCSWFYPTTSYRDFHKFIKSIFLNISFNKQRNCNFEK